MNNVEVELKLLIAPADILKLRRHPLLKALCPSGPKTRKLTSIYFDTDNFSLKNQGVALRVRRSGRQWIQTVKGGGRVQAGLHQRDEWEALVARDAPDFTKITDPGLVRLFASENLRQRLRPIFITEFNRTIWMLETESGDQVELAIDRGEIRADQENTPICEVELELKSGNPAVLYELALALHEAVPLCPENSSKADRGYALSAGQNVLSPVKATPLEITPEHSVNEAFCSIAWNCIDQLQGNRTQLVRDYDPELVHQMRVAVRRLRCAIGLFSVASPEIKNLEIIEDLRWLTAQLGPARDWDVFVGVTLPQVINDLPDDESLNWLQQKAEKICDKNHEQVLNGMSGSHYTEIMLRLGAWLGRMPWRSAADAAALDMPVLIFASKVLGRRYRKLCHLGREIEILDAAQRHVLRISAKKLRYAAEFFSGLYSGKAIKQYIKALSSLQDDLGLLNDQAVISRLMAQIKANGRSKVRASGVMMDWSASQSESNLANMAQSWMRFRQCGIFWEKG